MEEFLVRAISRKIGNLEQEVIRLKQWRQSAQPNYINQGNLYNNDNKELTQQVYGDITHQSEIDIDTDVSNIKTTDGQYISADWIRNNLSKALNNINKIMDQMDRLQKQINTSNGYVASNNFKTHTPSQEKLTNFVVECLQTSFKQMSKESIPVGTKIKNTFDNHIWIFNRITSNGLTTTKWEDFGSDDTCIAGNNGVHGLVAGSNDKFEGHIDIRGIISINGLKEEIDSLINIQSQLKTQIKEYKDRCDQLESRIRILEDK